MDLNQFLTEYDDSLGGDLNVDPLGLQVIWSAFGQDIFRYRVSSISNDVRNYTLNLFHHCLIKDLVEDERLRLSPQLGKTFERLDTLSFKTACLIYLENLFTYSMIAHQDDAGVDTGGVLGSAKARKRWGNKSEGAGNPSLLFGDTDKSYILVRQPLLGVSGRYKTPLVQMGFFDKNYHYSPQSAPLWKQAHALIKQVRPLSLLYRALRGHMEEVLSQPSKAPQVAFNQVPAAIKSGYVEAYKSPARVGSYAREFWLGVTHLDRGAAGALYRVLASAIGGSSKAKPQTIFTEAQVDSALSEQERRQIDRVRQLEPFLAELDLLFTLMLVNKQQTLDQVAALWAKYGRGPQVLRDTATDLEALLSQLSGTGKRRLQQLLKLAHLIDAKSQLHQLLTYHNGVMQDRGQSPWLRLSADGTLKLDVRSRREPDPEDRPRGHWVNHYYIPQFQNLLQGLLGGAA
ncbi:hypothetical protein AUP74_00680 [Microbulbifer aggregans]|uniref:Uncharacterized protein n=1 Tax=Microbulbifer aggregans TaxID=1769779 RepID=A0A1C9W4S7_9GAMM|nr:hypothetical protein [Microbulbifer aggregans]AOS96149.1 hypothetical protein AUP74_00680 [Microbulbifer aggregans]